MEKETQLQGQCKQWSTFDRHPKAEFELSEKTAPIRFLFEPINEKYRLRMTRPYYPQLLNVTQIAYFLGMSINDTVRALQNAKIFPVIHRKKSSMYTVKSVVTLARKLGKTFMIPPSFFSPPEHLFIGMGLKSLARIPHDGRTKVFSSFFEMFMEEGIPTQNIYVAPRNVKQIEREFLTIAGKAFKAYNSAVLATGGKTKHIYLCTVPGDRDYAESLATVFNKKYPGFIVAIDLEHLYSLRERFAKSLETK